MLAVFAVNNFEDLINNNVVVGSLRQAIQVANGNDEFDTIIFQDFLVDDLFNNFGFPFEIILNGGPLSLTDPKGISIIGPGPGTVDPLTGLLNLELGRLTITADANERIFLVDDGDDDRSSVSISGLHLRFGSPRSGDEDGRGGAILNREALTLTEVDISGNFAPNGGGAIYNDEFGFLQIERSLIRNNTSEEGGGGIQNGVEDLDDNLPITTIVNSTITGNTAIGIPDDNDPTGYGGGVLNLAGTVNIEQSTIYGNYASVDGGGVASRGFDPEREDPDTADNEFMDDFESGFQPEWDLAPAGSDGAWFVDDGSPISGTFSARSGNLIPNQSSILALTLTGPGELTFSYDVANDGVLRLLDGDVELDSWIAGESGSATFAVSAGDHTFRWKYDSGLSQGNASIDDVVFEPSDCGPATVFSGLATTNIRSSIIVGNESGDVGSIGMTEGDDDCPSEPFQPQINSFGYNLFGVLTHPATTVNMGVTLPPNGPNDLANVDPTTVFIDVPFFGGAWLNDFGGILPVFMPDVNKITLDSITGMPFEDMGGMPLLVNLAIDHGAPFAIATPDLFGFQFDQRGFQFERASDLAGGFFPIMDIGAAEVQVGNFVVNTLVDDFDNRFSDVPVEVGAFPLNLVEFVPDFSLREALEFARKNQLAFPIGTGTNTVTFSSFLNDPLFNTDPTPATSAPTILLTLGELFVGIPVIIQGPTLFELEIDATGNDLTPGVNDGDGSRVFNIFNTVEIRNLTLRGGDKQEFGGAIITSSNLTLRNMTLLDNFTSGRGGAIYVQGGTLLVDATTIHDNVSASSGGGIFVASGNVTVSNSTISGNTSSLHGGGIANADGNLLIRYSTITLNTADSTLGSGVASYRNASAVTEIRSSIISGNTINDVQHVAPGAPNIVSLGYNLVGDGNAVLAGVFAMPGDQSFTDPMLAPLARLGGPTLVHRLLSDSPAIDMGDPNAAGLGNVPTYDQRGFPFDRIEDLAGGGRIDIGSFEVQDDVLLVGNGSSAEGSYATFFDALTESNLTPKNETIVFLPTWPGEIFPSGLLEITDSVDIIGLVGNFFFGNPNLEILIDDGDNMSLLDVSIENIRMQNNVRIVNRENLTISNMEFVDNAAFANGGAISHENGKLTISDSTFIGNSTFGSGGAIYVLNGDLEINNSFLSGNSTGVLGGNGGAIYIRDGDFTANYLYVTGNTAAAAAADGGGIYGRNSTMTLTQAIISGNSTTGSNSEGGGLFAKDSDITLIDSAISFNTTHGSQSRGGGIFLDGGSLDIQNGNLFRNKTYGQFSSGGGIASVNADVTITGTSVDGNEVNGVSTHGGGIHAIGGDLTIRDSAVINNTASASGSKGGGIFSDTNLTGTETVSIFNSTISGNTATHRGGGIYHADGLMEITYSTITDNSVPYFGNGGGVASFGNSGTTRTEVRSSIIAGNLSTGDLINPNSDVDSVGGNVTNSFVSLGYNVIGKGLPLALDAFNQMGDQTNIVDPGLNSLTLLNGGPTATHALLPTSPAINAGDPSAVADMGIVPENDQRRTGFSRVKNGRIDVGAFESDLSPLVVYAPTDFNNDGVVSGFDFLAWQLGFGKPNATKADGDSNGDMVVDSVDLNNWELAYGSSAPLSASQSGSEPLAETAVAAEEPLPLAVATETSLAADSSTTELAVSQSASASDSTNLAQRNVVFVMGIVQASPVLSSPKTAVQEVETAAIDQSLAEYRPISSSSGSMEESMDYGDIAVSRPAREEAAESEDEFLVEDAVFAALGEGL